MKLKSKEVATIKSALRAVTSELEDNYWNDNIRDHLSIIWDILDRNNDKDNSENSESSN